MENDSMKAVVVAVVLSDKSVAYNVEVRGGGEVVRFGCFSKACAEALKATIDATTSWFETD